MSSESKTEEGEQKGNDPPQPQLQLQAKEKTCQSEIKLNVHFSSFISLRSALHKYQKENHVQLIVKDSKLLSSESIKKIIPKVYHLVNQKLMYHSITYCCKCHGELKQKPGSRIKNIGAKRLSCPMYMRFKLSTDLQSLVLFDILEAHNHSTDFNTFQLSPRQQVYRLSAIKRGKPDPGDSRQEVKKACKPSKDVQTLIATAIKDVNSISSLGEADYEPPEKNARIPSHTKNEPSATGEAKSKRDVLEESSDDDDEVEQVEDETDNVLYMDNPYSLLDPESSCSDSDEEEFRKHRDILPFPIRLIGSAIQSNPELTSLTKELIASQLEVVNSSKRRLILQNKMLELKNAKLALELKSLEKSHAASVSAEHDQATTFYLQS